MHGQVRQASFVKVFNRDHFASMSQVRVWPKKLVLASIEFWLILPVSSEVTNPQSVVVHHFHHGSQMRSEQLAIVVGPFQVLGLVIQVGVQLLRHRLGPLGLGEDSVPKHLGVPSIVVKVGQRGQDGSQVHHGHVQLLGHHGVEDVGVELVFLGQVVRKL